MKKTILSILFSFTICLSFSQVSLLRYSYANKDTIRTQVLIAVVSNAVNQIDTATNANQRLCADVLTKPRDGAWLDIFVFQICTLLSTTNPSDVTITGYVQQLWNRCALLNTRR